MNDYKNKKRNLIERLKSGPVICAEGFLFEIEKRGYMASGEFVPMVSLDHPEVLENLHRDFNMLALTSFKLLLIMGTEKRCVLLVKKNY